jgi:anti-anti-sigma factor
MALRLAEARVATRDGDGPDDAMRAAAAFRVDVAREGGGMRITPVGEVDSATIGHVRESVEEALAAGVGRVILDFRETTFLDSTGLHLAIDAADGALLNGTDFAIIAGPPAVQRTFEVAGLNERLPFVDVPRG